MTPFRRASHIHAARVRDSFLNQGIPTAAYLSDTDPLTRTSILELFAMGDVKVLCVVDILNEGIDLPFVECLLFLRPTESKRIFVQQLGRGLRHYYGKRHCIVIDFIGNFRNGYRIVEYRGLDPYDAEEEDSAGTLLKSVKEILNLPIGCTVECDERVIGIFGDQTLSPAFATRHNIGRILIYQYRRLQMRLGNLPTRRDVDHSLILGSSFYVMVFGSWNAFMEKIEGGCWPLLAGIIFGEQPSSLGRHSTVFARRSGWISDCI